MRRIDMAFTDLLAPAVGFLPGPAGLATKAQFAALEAACAAARASRDLPRWPPACLELLQAMEAVAAHQMTALRAGEIGRATSASWPEPHGWWALNRRETGAGLDDVDALEMDTLPRARAAG